MNLGPQKTHGNTSECRSYPPVLHSRRTYVAMSDWSLVAKPRDSALRCMRVKWVYLYPWTVGTLWLFSGIWQSIQNYTQFLLRHPHNIMQMTARVDCLRDPCRETSAHTLMGGMSPVLGVQRSNPCVCQLFILHWDTFRSNRVQHMDSYCSYVELSPRIYQSLGLNPCSGRGLTIFGFDWAWFETKDSISSFRVEHVWGILGRCKNPLENARLTAPDQKVLQLPLPREALPGDSRQPTACMKVKSG